MGNNTTFVYSQIHKDDPPPVVHFKNSLGSRWYKVMFGDVRVGRSLLSRSIRVKSGEPLYQFSLEEQLRLQIMGTTNNVKRNEEKIFSSKPPYPLLYYKYTERVGKRSQSLLIRRIAPEKYEYTINPDYKEAKSTTSYMRYNLDHELQLEMWLLTAPQKDNSKSFRKFDLNALKIESIVATIMDIDSKRIDGVMTRNYKLITANNGKNVRILNYNNKGELLYTAGIDQLEHHFEEQKPLLPVKNSADIYTRNIVPINQKIGPIETIKELQLAISGPNIELLETSPGQRVEYDKNTERCTVTLSRNNPKALKKSRSETNIDKYRRPSFRIKSDLPEIQKLAREAIGETTLREKQVEKLSRFVNDYIDYGYVFRTDIETLLKTRKGDCSEHALLFASLARALDIPCREISGLVYMGDWCQGFGLHAWNEVFCNGRWKAVDATNGTTNIQPVYIRFTEDPFKEIQLLYSTHDMRIMVEEILRSEASPEIKKLFCETDE